MIYKATHLGHELELMINNEKPMSVFYRYVADKYDEKDGQDFDKHVRQGLFDRIIFYVSEKHSKKKIIYYIYTQKTEKWRATLYKELKKSFEWNLEMEYIEGFLLGYSHEQNLNHLNIIRNYSK